MRRNSLVASVAFTVAALEVTPAVPTDRRRQKHGEALLPEGSRVGTNFRHTEHAGCREG